MIVQASLESGFPEIAIIAILVSIVTFMVFVKAFHSIYLKPQPKNLKVADKSIPKSSIISITILLLICIIIGLFPNLITDSFSHFAVGLI
jgi:energy-converting hydrogenase B subunit F